MGNAIATPAKANQSACAHTQGCLSTAACEMFTELPAQPAKATALKPAGGNFMQSKSLETTRLTRSCAPDDDCSEAGVLAARSFARRARRPAVLQNPGPAADNSRTQSPTVLAQEGDLPFTNPSSEHKGNSRVMRAFLIVSTGSGLLMHCTASASNC